ncbi:hypothetical protein GC173_11105 [bacterium]|nr:hypothetical protein [bacterium]
MAKTFLSAFMASVLALSSAATAFDELKPVTDPQPPGALSGASVFVSPGHGWMLNANGRWGTQRGVSHGLIEDHSNAEAVLQFLVPYLWNAGARVYTTRERDMNTNMVILDAGSSKDVKLTGKWETWRGPNTWQNDCIWTESTSGEATASATFTPKIPEDGYYAVYAWYRTAPTVARTKEGGRLPTATDARFVINHTGGTTVWTQDLNRDGGTWTYLGRYWFEKGKDAAKGSVVIDNHTDGPGSAFVIDAIRFGGGMGDTLADGRPSGKPRWEESGMYYALFAGYSPEADTRGFNSVSAMPMWAEWECEDWELGKSIYIAWHTNAANGRARGLSSFIYGPNAWEGQDYFIGFPAGLELQNIVHERIMAGVRQKWDATWADYGRITRWLGETNPRNNNRMPAALFEYGFHDNAEDAAYILHPQFRDVIARSTMEGVVEFYTKNMDGFTTTTLLPSVPTHFATIAEGDGVRLTWQPAKDGDPATSYRVMTSPNGKGFDNGGLTEKTSVLIPAPAPGETRYYRVAARNAGGESFPSETLAVRTPLEGERRVLLVNGFDRLDREMNLVQEDGAQRGFLDRMNSHDYAIQHGSALAARGIAFNSTSNEALTSDTLKGYPAVVWMLGQEKGATEAFSTGEQALVREYLSGDGALLVSGTEWANDLASAENGKGFLATLGVADSKALSDAADIRPVVGAKVFTQFPPLGFEKGNDGAVYPVRVASGLTPAEGAKALLQFGEGGPTAMLASTTTGRVVASGVPFETLQDAEQRASLMGAVMEFLLDGTIKEMETASLPQ